MAVTSFKHKIAVVTGAGRGMGRAMALAFAGAGCDVAIGSLLAGATRTDQELSHLPAQQDLEKVHAEIEALGVHCFSRGLDVTSNSSVDTFVSGANDAFGKIDILANAAGLTAAQTVSGHPDPLWHKVIDVNLNGIYRTTRLCLPVMMERGWGRIINIASTAASVGAATSAAYCASKAGVVGLSRCVALEGAAHGVTCNAISPTWVETKFGTCLLYTSPSPRDATLSRMPSSA